MKSDKRGELTYTQIIGFIIAVIVLVLVVTYFTGTFQRVQSPVNFTLGTVEHGIECKKFCDNNDRTGYFNAACEKDSSTVCAKFA